MSQMSQKSLWIVATKDIDKQTKNIKNYCMLCVGASTQAPTLLNPTLDMAFQDPLIIINFIMIILINYD